jgi:predicted dehydrogenase
LHFDGDVTADCECSYTKQQNLMNVRAERGWFQLEPAYEYEGIKGKTSSGDISFQEVNQQALQMDDFVNCIKENKPTRVPAEMGLRDMQIIAAVYEAANTGSKVPIELKAFKSMVEY